MREECLSERFWIKVRKGPDGECWNWTGAVNSSGYGNIRVGRTNQQAHRVAWRIMRGEAPRGKFLCHQCDNRLCVNPDHLFVGTAQDNNSDRHAKGRSRGGSMRGSSNPMARITEADAVHIAHSTTPLAVEAARYGLPFQSISDIRRGKVWSHATGVMQKPWRENGLTPLQRRVLEALHARAVGGIVTIGDAEVARALGYEKRHVVSCAKQRLAKAGFVKMVGRGIWRVAGGGT